MPIIKNEIKIIISSLSPNPGCEYCEHLKEKNDWLYCNYKEKYLNAELKKCRYFNEKFKIKS